MLTSKEIAALLVQDAARLTERAAEIIRSAEPDDPENNGAASLPDDRLITAKEAARLLGCGESTLYGSADKFPFTRRGPGGVRFSLRGVRAWIAGQQPDGPAA
jgi:predicted DNA-binding transcriptional regulator AlpA